MSGDASDLPVSIRIVVSGPGPPEPELGDTLGLPDFSTDIDPGPGESFPRSGSILARPVFLDACAPGPGRSLPESGGILDEPGFCRSGKPFPSYGGALSERDSWDAIVDEHEELPCESGARLHQLNFTGGMDAGDGVHWSDVLNIVSNFGPGPERSFPGSGGIMKFPDVLDTMDTGPGNVSLEAGVESIWPEFGGMAPGNMAGLWLLTLISESRQFSTSTTGNVPLSDDSGICCLHTTTLLGPLSISDDTAGARLFIPDDMISCIMRLPCQCAILPGDSVLRMWFGCCLVPSHRYIWSFCLPHDI